MIADENDERLFFMTKESKNILTRESCQKELVRWAKGETVSDIIYNMKRRLIATWDFLTKEYDLDPRETMTDSRIITLLGTILYKCGSSICSNA